MNRRIVKSKKISNQSLYDVVEDFYRLDYDIDKDVNEHASNYAIIRLITIMEQFCRGVVEARLEKHTDQIPQKIEINHQLLDDLLESAVSGANGDIKNAIISMSYSFQDVYSICGEMKNFRLLNERSELKNKIIELEPLFQARHALVHTVEPSTLDAEHIALYRGKVEEVIHRILDVLDMPMYDFDILKGHAFREMTKRMCLRNMSDIKNLDKLPDILGSTECNSEAGWFDKANKFHNVSVACFDSALERFLTRIKSDPSRLDVLSEIAWIYKNKDEHRNAGKYADIVLKSDPKDTVACYCKGMYLLAINKPAALEYFEKAVTGEIYLPDAHTKTIEVLLNFGAVEKALLYADQAIIMEPDNPVLYILKGKILNQLKLHAYGSVCYTIGDKHAIEFMKDYRNDVLTCGETIYELQNCGRDETVKKCSQVLRKRFKYDYNVKESASPDPRTRSTPPTIDSE